MEKDVTKVLGEQRGEKLLFALCIRADRCVLDLEGFSKLEKEVEEEMEEN